MRDDSSSLNRDAIAADAPARNCDRQRSPFRMICRTHGFSHRFNTTVKGNDRSAFENLRVNEAVKMLYDFMWHDFCELVRGVRKQTGLPRRATGKFETWPIVNRAIRIYEETLKLLHPFMPFRNGRKSGSTSASAKQAKSIMISPWPAFDESLINAKTESNMEFLQNVISAVPHRTERNLKPASHKKKFPLSSIATTRQS